MEKKFKLENEYFYFKKFRIKHPKRGLKVTTEACIFGAFCSLIDSKNVIDIGTGTGILSLMYAQKNINSNIISLEIDKDVFENALLNFENSNYKNQINPINLPIQAFNQNEKFDLIICNPPFYKDNLKGKNETQNIALHDDTLNMDDLLLFIKKHLSDNGKAALLFPFYESLKFEKIALENGLFTNEIIHIYNLPGKHFRNIHFYSFKNTDQAKTTNFLVKNTQNEYTEEMHELMLDFYL